MFSSKYRWTVCSSHKLELMIAQHQVQMCHIQWISLAVKGMLGTQHLHKRIETSTSPPFQSGSCFHGSVTCRAEVGSLLETQLPQGLHYLSLWMKWAPSENKCSSFSANWCIKVMHCEDLVQTESKYAHYHIISLTRNPWLISSNSLPDSSHTASSPQAKKETVTQDENIFKKS